MLSRVVAVLFAVIASYWYGRARSWEAFFTAAGFILWYLGAETYVHYRSDRKVAADRELFTQFVQELPFEGTIRFLRDHDLRVVFNRSRLDDLHRFTQTWTNPSRKFHDKRIERAKERLRNTANEFLGDLAINTWPQGADDLQEIPKEWRTEQPERYEQVSARLDRRAGEVVGQYENLITVARRRLQV